MGRGNNSAEVVAVYPGAFDPFTNGHVDIVNRALNMFDRLIIAVAVNAGKKPLFGIEERIEMIREIVGKNPRLEIDTFDGLLVDYVESRGAGIIIRGLRAVSDFDYEFQMALMNRRLRRKVETVFLMTGLRWIFISSTLIKEVAGLGGSVEGLVPDIVARKLRDKLAPGPKSSSDS
ncbi:MAG: pantetheine-phosphate adenylyltransferase [Pseudomonadota bacterium]